MKIHFMGKYNGDEDSLPHLPHRPGAVAFKEPDSKSFAIILNIVSIVVFIPLILFLFFYAEPFNISKFFIGSLISVAAMFPHEILHALCFKEDAYIYNNLKKGMLFVVGPEDMTKSRFILMALLPNVVFGFIPFVIFLIFPSFLMLGSLGAIAIAEGVGDYMNVFNALTQMPKGAKTYLYKFHSFWYLP